MRQQGVVYQIEEGKTAIVEVVRHSACSGNCESCGGCGHHADQTIRVRAENRIGAQAGERVWLETETRQVFTSIGAAYILPVLLMILFYFLPGGGEGRRILASLGGFPLGVGLCWLYARQLGRKSHVHAIITDRIH